MKHRGRWPQRDYQEVTGQPINVSFRLTGAQKAWVDDAAETSGRSLAQEFSAMAQRAIAADTDLLNSHDLTFGPANVAFMLLTGLVLAEIERGAAYQWGEQSETDAVAATTLSEMLSILFDINIADAWPATIQQMQIQAGLRPLFEIGEFLAG